MNASDTTLVCVFYSVFVGTVWGLIPKVSGTEPLNWKYFLPPFMLVVLMMFSVKMRMVAMSSEVVMITAMSLLHFRAGIISFTRLTDRARIFCWAQLGCFAFGMLYLFQQRLVPFTIPRSLFFVLMMGFSTLSIGLLLTVKGKPHVEATEETHDTTVSS